MWPETDCRIQGICRLVYVTPCHYDPWTDASGTNRNPFYLVTSAPLAQKLKL